MVPQREQLPRAHSCLRPTQRCLRPPLHPRWVRPAGAGFLPLLRSHHRCGLSRKNPQALPKGSASGAASPALCGARSLLKVNVLRGGPGGIEHPPHPAARLKSVTARFMLSRCASALSQFLSGARRGRQSVAVFFGLLMVDASSPKPYTEHLALPSPACRHFIIPNQGMSLAICRAVALTRSGVRVSRPSASPPSQVPPHHPRSWSRVAGKALAAFQRFRSGSPSLL